MHQLPGLSSLYKILVLPPFCSEAKWLASGSGLISHCSHFPLTSCHRTNTPDPRGICHSSPILFLSWQQFFFFLFLCFYKKKNSHVNTSLWIVLWLWETEKALTSWNSYNIDRETLCSFLWVTTPTLLKMVLPFNLYLNLFIIMTNLGLILS